MDIGSYLQRIDFIVDPKPDLDILTALHQAHLHSVPFENIDVQLGIPLTISVQDAYRKIVERGRGGWCYEQNGVFAWALSSLGFEVTRIAASVMREERGAVATANHLCLLVKIPGYDKNYLVDVGFGGSLMRPIMLCEGEYKHAPFSVSLKKTADLFWRFSETLGDQCMTFDFTEQPAHEEQLASRSTYLQTDLSSNFVRNLVAQSRRGESHYVLRGKIFTRRSPDGAETRETMSSAGELVDVLAKEFRLDVPEVATLWPQIVARHEELFGSGSL